MRIGFIGTGAMVSAIVRGVAAAGGDTSGFVLADTNTTQALALAEEVGASVAADNREVVHLADIVVLGVKPHVQATVLADIAPALRANPTTCLVSIAAGRSLATIRRDAEVNVPLVRVMPNVNAQIGHGMAAICHIDATPEQLEAVRSLLGAVGRTVDLDEAHFAVFSAIASCSPAWVFEIIDALARAGVKHGLTKAASVEIAAQALAGSAELVLARAADGLTPTQLIDQVTSPGGTTIAGLLAAEEAGLSTSLVKAVDATVARDRELG